MKKWTLTAAALGLGVGLATGASLRSFRNGVYYTPDTVEEKLEFNESGDNSRFSHFRAAASIPKDYGRLAGVTSGESGATLWFEDAEGNLRNVFVEESRLIHIRRSGTSVARRP
ncbi:MAG TPA: hypothetical protein PK362_01745 [Elusimicrobiota bacterium]|nr:hypothetical protein [Elusimicrobiota bacterium]